MENKEEILMSYIAGLIDGDGCVTFSKTRSRGEIVYHPVLQLHNSIQGMPALLKEVFGGTLAVDKPKKETYKSIHKWMMQGYVGCKMVLEKITPFLITKKIPAIHLQEFLNKNVPTKGKFLRFNTELLEAEKVYLTLKSYTRNRKYDLSILKKPVKKCTNNEKFWAYMAGLMETDGSFSVQREIRKPTKKNRQLNDLIKYRPAIQLTMVTGNNLNHILSNTCLGDVYTIKAACALKGVAYKLNIKIREEVIQFLKYILPYLRFKKQQAEILLDFCEKYVPTTNCREKVPEDEKEFRERCYKEIVKLNKGTPSTLT